MKLSEALDKYLLTSVSEGTNLVYWADVSNNGRVSIANPE